MTSDQHESRIFFVFAVIGLACFFMSIFKDFDLLDTVKMIVGVIFLSSVAALSFNQFYRNKLIQIFLLLASVFWFLYWTYLKNDFLIGFLLLLCVMVIHFVLAVLRDIALKNE